MSYQSLPSNCKLCDTEPALKEYDVGHISYYRNRTTCYSYFCSEKCRQEYIVLNQCGYCGYKESKDFMKKIGDRLYCLSYPYQPQSCYQRKIVEGQNCYVCQKNNLKEDDKSIYYRHYSIYELKDSEDIEDDFDKYKYICSECTKLFETGYESDEDLECQWCSEKEDTKMINYNFHKLILCDGCLEHLNSIKVEQIIFEC